MKTIRLEPVKWCACGANPIASGFKSCMQCVSDGEREMLKRDFMFEENVRGVPQSTRKMTNNELRDHQ